MAGLKYFRTRLGYGIFLPCGTLHPDWLHAREGAWLIGEIDNRPINIGVDNRPNRKTSENNI